MKFECGKVKYESRSLAQKAIHNIKRHKGDDDRGVKIYLCESCNAFHWGRQWNRLVPRHKRRK